MSINYYCELATDASVDDIVHRIHALLGGKIEDRVSVVTNALVASVREETDPVARKWALEDWGIDARRTVSFRLIRTAPEEEYYAAQREFPAAMVRLAEDLDVDALLLLEQDRVLMRRQKGVVIVYDWWADRADPRVVVALPSGYTLTSDRQNWGVSSSVFYWAVDALATRVQNPELAERLREISEYNLGASTWVACPKPSSAPSRLRFVIYRPSPGLNYLHPPNARLSSPR